LRSMHGYLREAQRSYYETYQFADVFARPRRAPDSVRPALAAIPGVARLDTRIVVDVQLAVPGLPEPATGRLISFPVPDGPRVNRLFLRRGRLLEMRDVEAVLVNDAFAQANALGVGSQVRAALNGRWRSLRVAGIVLSPEFVYAVRPGEVFPDNRHFGIIWMAAPALAAAVDMTGAFSDVAMTLDEQASRAEVLAAVDRVLERFGGGLAAPSANPLRRTCGRGESECPSSRSSCASIAGTALPATPQREPDALRSGPWSTPTCCRAARGWCRRPTRRRARPPCA